MKILILKTIQEGWLYVNPLAIVALNEEYHGTTITMMCEITDSQGRKGKRFTVEDELESLMKLINHSTS